MGIHQPMGIEVLRSLRFHACKEPFNPPLGVGYCKFLSHPINMSIKIFMIQSKYWAQETGPLADITVSLDELGKMVSPWQSW
jgi:hypothetical protein